MFAPFISRSISARVSYIYFDKFIFLLCIQHQLGLKHRNPWQVSAFMQQQYLELSFGTSITTTSVIDNTLRSIFPYRFFICQEKKEEFFNIKHSRKRAASIGFRKEKYPFRMQQNDGGESEQGTATTTRKKSHGIIPEIPKLECLCLNQTHINFKTKSFA